jgi:hypothetical protein
VPDTQPAIVVVVSAAGIVAIVGLLAAVLKLLADHRKRTR